MKTFAWEKEVLLQSPLFAPLHPILSELDTDNFPTLQNCNALLEARPLPITTESGAPLRFVVQQPGKLSFEDQYEPRCYLKGEVQMRSNNWHDFFSALVWLSFPKTKAIINARHYHALMSGMDYPTNAGRGSIRDVNTLFDESGVIVAYADTELSVLLQHFKWKELFWQRREQVRGGMRFYLFGHGLYEKSLQPYVGMTGQGLLLGVEPAFFAWPMERQLSNLDSLLAAYLAEPEHCHSTRDLAPVPVLGVPDWSADNDNAAYYDNTAYFRPGRR